METLYSNELFSTRNKRKHKYERGGGGIAKLGEYWWSWSHMHASRLERGKGEAMYLPETLINFEITAHIREAAFVYASTAAGVVYAVTQACSMGALMHCSCDHTKRDRRSDGEWEWGGCGDDVDYGYRKSREFMDARKRKRRGDFTTKLQLHNNEAGRVAVSNYMRKVCKCHGLSGSCTLKTCWKKMPTFREVGNRLKDKFDGAIRVIISNDGKNIIPEGRTIKPPSQSDLVYSDTSPNFCKKNRKVGSLGTQDRECDPDSEGVGGCDLLCCNRGFTKNEVLVKENCKCRFVWCCDVTCETCESTKLVHRCL
ncbi:protein wnt [Plakobranchus ocellatus]|uniref:Protein Wnt n=1 Tax=Plakobranchus ocellatus TaxID=259542 RepID=A0AAV4D0Q8_9GAST|nr:protein wnt [Plakobranchus ocellatus]